MPKKNIMKFELVDNTRQNEYNESCKMEKIWYGETSDGEILGIEEYWNMCKQFAAAMGFAESTIQEWFGTY